MRKTRKHNKSKRNVHLQRTKRTGHSSLIQQVKSARKTNYSDSDFARDSVGGYAHHSNKNKNKNYKNNDDDDDDEEGNILTRIINRFWSLFG